MIPSADRVGQKFNRWTILKIVEIGIPTKALARCECGTERVVALAQVTNGRRRSCGCFMRESKTKHGLSGTPEYNIWRRMRQRCYSPNDVGFKNYGGRGITMCARWLDSFSNFYADMGPRPSEKHQIDRIDNDAGYHPENCRWVTQDVNLRNTRRTKKKTGGAA